VRGPTHPYDILTTNESRTITSTLIQLVRALTTGPDVWVTRKGAVLIIGIAALLGLVLGAIVFDSSLWQALVSAGAGASSLGLWFAARHYYLTSGTGIRAGLAVRGFRLGADDLSETRGQLRRHFGQSSNCPITVRQIPYSQVSETKTAQQYESRYAFDVIFAVVISPPRDNSPNHYYEVDATVSPWNQQVSRQFLAATNSHALALLRGMQDAPDWHSYIRFRTQSLFECMLLVLSAHAFGTGRNREATELARSLDVALSTRMASTEYPRNAVRWLYSASAIRLVSFEMANLPGPDRLQESLDVCRAACDHCGSEFPAVYLIYARILVLAHELEEARKVAEYALSLKPEEYQSIFVFNAFAASVLSGRDVEAARYSQSINVKQLLAETNVDDLVLFADHCAELGFSGAVFLQALYRRWRGDLALPDDMFARALSWSASTHARRPLYRMLRDARPPERAPTRPHAATGPSKRRRRPRPRH